MLCRADGKGNVVWMGWDGKGWDGMIRNGKGGNVVWLGLTGMVWIDME